MHQTPTPSDDLATVIRRFESGEHDAAIAGCQALVERRPDNHDARGALALMLLKSGRLDDGIAQLDSVLAARPDDGAARASRGIARAQLRREGARDDLERGLALDPAQPDAWLALAALQRQAGEAGEAIATLRRATHHAPGHPAIAGNLAGLIAEHGDAAEAVALLQPIVAAAPDHAGPAYNLGTALRRLGRNAEAEAHLRRATVLEPGFSPAWHNLGNVLVDLGRATQGFAAFERATAIRRRPGGPAGSDHSFTMTRRSKLEHDIEQLEHLRGRAILGPDWDATIAAYRRVRDDLGPGGSDMVPLPPSADPIRANYNRLIHGDPGARIDGPAVAPGFDGAAIEAMYRDNQPGIAWGDGLLTPAALAALRRFCLESTIWYEFRYDNGYLGAFQEEGFCCPLLLQIAEELRAAMPDVIGPHDLARTWAFKYDSHLAGIRMHADSAAVNVNFWLTPDEANLDPNGGGLVVWDREAPLDWEFARYNRDTPAVRRFLEQSGAAPVSVAHRQNRAVIFNSDLFHETARLTFREGYENRRINVTMLFGRRGD